MSLRGRSRTLKADMADLKADMMKSDLIILEAELKSDPPKLTLAVVLVSFVVQQNELNFPFLFSFILANLE